MGQSGRKLKKCHWSKADTSPWSTDVWSRKTSLAMSLAIDKLMGEGEEEGRGRGREREREGRGRERERGRKRDRGEREREEERGAGKRRRKDVTERKQGS